MTAADRESRVLVLLPSQKDARHTVERLAEVGIDAAPCTSLPDLCHQIAAGAGAALLTEEAALQDVDGRLRRTLQDQPAWSALPLVLLTPQRHPGPRPAIEDAAPNLVLVERPVRTRTLVSVLRAALRARAHQYQVRDGIARLRESEERFRTLVAQVRDYAIFSTDQDGRAITWNAGVHRLLGYPQDQFQGASLAQLFTPEDRDAGLPARLLARASQAGAATDERWMVRKDGAPFWASVSATALRSATAQLTSFTIVLRDLTSWKIAQDDLARHRDHLDALVKARTAELEESHARLRLSERMATIGTLSAGLGHDMGNLLMPLRMRLDSLADEVSTPEAKDDLDTIRTVAAYLGRLAVGLRMLARDPENPDGPAEVDVHRWWPEAEPVLRNSLPRGVTLEADLDPAVTLLPLSPEGLTQVAFNLVQNAGTALQQNAGRGHVRVRCRALPRSNGDAPQAELRIEDDGPGMTDEVKRRCFEPFFSTKPRGISTGMGLALVHGIVHAAGGTIDVDSSLGQGTTFRLTLPVVRA